MRAIGGVPGGELGEAAMWILREGGFPSLPPLPPLVNGTEYKVVACSTLGHSVAETSRAARARQAVLIHATRLETMLSARSAIALTLVLLVLAKWSVAMPTTDKDKERLLNTVDLIDDDGSIETALINYLFTKQIVKRLRNQLDIGDLQRKRSYWKQCAFNAVSCFGK
ncbi:hypothetical protein HN011_009275 [Eciton burchellii]|nr:hypothetical protein HN011_009275 [Eciton burchellii]